MDLKVKVVIADDSALMRREIKRILETDPGIEVIGVARNGQEALELTQSLDPDVVTLDINMPIMDGMTALQYIMMECPKPIIMLSSLTQDGAVTSYEALELGAVDFVAKPGGTVSTNIQEVANDLIYKVKSASGSNLSAAKAARKRKKQQSEALERVLSTQKSKPSTSDRMSGRTKLIVIGQSTGGPNTIMEIIPEIPKDFPHSILIVQHMPSTFTPSFAQRLNRSCAIPFKEASPGDLIEPQHGLLAPGDIHTILAPGPVGSKKIFIRTSKFPEDSLHKPSVDVTMESVLASYYPKDIIGVILTGMGTDGAKALMKIRSAGGRTIAESEETAVVFGMPKEAIRLGGAEFVLPAYEIGKKIIELADQ